MNTKVLFNMMSDEEVAQLVRDAREERHRRCARKNFAERIRAIIHEAESMGINVVSKETGEILDDLPFYFY